MNLAVCFVIVNSNISSDYLDSVRLTARIFFCVDSFQSIATFVLVHTSQFGSLGKMSE